MRQSSGNEEKTEGFCGNCAAEEDVLTREDWMRIAEDGQAKRNAVLADFIRRQRAFSEKTFGEGKRTLGVTDHIAKELEEIRRDPDDVKEWIDVILLAFDGYWRHGGEPDRLLPMLEEKFAINRARKWGPITPDRAIEHVRDEVRDSQDLDDGC